MNKYEFSQEDYLMYQDFFKYQLENLKVVAIDSAGKSENQKHDKTFRGILKDKKEMSKFLKQFIGLEVKAEDLEIYNSNFINKHYERRESDIIYINKKVYFLIEHQSKVDKNMPQRIKVEEKYKKYVINLTYQLIDINQYNKYDLIKYNTKVSSMMVLEKCHNKEDVQNTLIELRMLTKDKERIEWIEDLITYIFPDVLGEDTEKMLEIIRWSEEKDMEDLVERIKKNEEKIKRALIRKGKKEIQMQN